MILKSPKELAADALALAYQQEVQGAFAVLVTGAVSEDSAGALVRFVRAVALITDLYIKALGTLDVLGGH